MKNDFTTNKDRGILEANFPAIANASIGPLPELSPENISLRHSVLTHLR